MVLICDTEIFIVCIPLTRLALAPHTFLVQPIRNKSCSLMLCSVSFFFGRLCVYVFDSIHSVDDAFCAVSVVHWPFKSACATSSWNNFAVMQVADFHLHAFCFSCLFFHFLHLVYPRIFYRCLVLFLVWFLWLYLWSFVRQFLCSFILTLVSCCLWMFDSLDAMSVLLGIYSAFLLTAHSFFGSSDWIIRFETFRLCSSCGRHELLFFFFLVQDLDSLPCHKSNRKVNTVKKVQRDERRVTEH